MVDVTEYGARGDRTSNEQVAIQAAIDTCSQSGGGALIQGMPESPIENLTLQNVSLRVGTPIDYARRHKPKGSARSSPDDRDTLYARQHAYLTLAHVRGLTVDTVCLTMTERAFAQYERSVLSGHHLEDSVLRNIRRRPAGKEGQAPAIALHDCQRVQREP
jgi:hypothetical protein